MEYCNEATILTTGDVKSVHNGCVICGTQNPFSMKLSFRAAGRGRVEAQFQPHCGLQGYKGILHGGVITAMLDAAMTHCLFHQGIVALTGDLRVRFLLPVPCDSEIDLTAWIVSSTPPLYRLKAELSLAQQVMAHAEAKFMRKGV